MAQNAPNEGDDVDVWTENKTGSGNASPWFWKKLFQTLQEQIELAFKAERIDYRKISQ